MATELAGQVLSVMAVLALLLGLQWWLRRKGFLQVRQFVRDGGRNRQMEVLESRVLAHGNTVYLLRVAGRALVLSAHASGCTLLDSREWKAADPVTGRNAA
ncbi:MAG: flagellar biosynthetic protein FliO [Bryobacteraceae bacterium]